MSQLSGPAARVGERHNAWVAYTPPAITGGPTLRLSPIASWFVAFDANNPVEIGPQAVPDYAVQLTGRLDHEYRETLARERTLAGRVARFVTLPREVREAAGLPPKSLSGRAVFGISVVVQAAVTAAAGAVLTAAALRALGL